MTNETLTQEFGEMFERYARDFFSPQLDSNDYGFRPVVDVQETEREYTVTAILPGIKEEDIHLSLKENSLVIEGKKETMKDGKAGFYNFYRTVPLRVDVSDTDIKATFITNILTVELVKKADGTEKTHRILINKH